MPELVPPSARYKASFIDAVREAQALGSGLGDTLEFDVAEMEQDFASVLAELRRFEPPAVPPEGFVNSEALWLVQGDTYLGRVSLRHRLNERLRVFGGHIGYEIRPSARQQGYGTLALRLALGRARGLGLERVLVTCDADNLGSRRIIETNGGELEGEFRLDFHPKVIRRYWIAL
ncbi:GNAT family N-acetyltransferase [Deinococcus koreensis]|uniref:GNAT family N-acetyltransferase n=1 Tax=Deinococcus koreensis TaxID=2054903 RepID=A0A2K3V0A1_9DEIO|nr:GNAT family N-acetyltransferase [Deinococcus koreensis]PNY82201.1 GNAT family N-acetyltransferase [Deinococcus koreensis]